MEDAARPRLWPSPRTMQLRIEQALRQLPLSEETASSVTARLLNSHSPLQQARGAYPGGEFFDFRSKVHAVAEHFRPHGLELNDYLRAAIRKPQLFYLSPAVVIGHVEAVAEHFRPHGLALNDYLRRRSQAATLLSFLCRRHRPCRGRGRAFP